jgi:hypothetical protein
LAPTVGIAATGFCYPGGILQFFHRHDQQVFHRQDQQIFHRQDQQFLRLPTAAVRSHLDGSSSTARSDQICVYPSRKSFIKISNADTADDTWSKDTR